jgi:hypothetical protein
MHACRVDINRYSLGTSRASEQLWRRRAAPGRVKLTNKQRCLLLSFSSFSTHAAHPQSDHMSPTSPSPPPAPPSTISIFFFFLLLLLAAGAGASQRSRYVLYIMRRRNKLRFSFGCHRSPADLMGNTDTTPPPPIIIPCCNLTNERASTVACCMYLLGEPSVAPDGRLV